MNDSKEKAKRHGVSSSEDPENSPHSPDASYSPDSADSPDSPDSPDSRTMHHRGITLPDGRYMIFYTFGAEGIGCSAQSNDQGNV